jgi:hypothetical protein
MNNPIKIAGKAVRLDEINRGTKKANDKTVSFCL